PAPRDRELGALAARVARGVRRARERAVGDDGDLRQELREPADGGRLAGPARPLHEDAADGRIDGVEQERPLEALLLDDCREREEADGRPYPTGWTNRLPKVGSACTIGGNCQVPISGTAVSRFTFTSTTYGRPAESAVANASARSPGWSTEIAPAPIAWAIAAKSGFQSSPVECLTKLVPISRLSM